MTFGLLPALLVACPKPPAEPAFEPPPVLRYAPPPREVTWREVSMLGGLGRHAVRVRQTWTGPREEPDRLVWTVTESIVDEHGERVRERYVVYFGPDGFGTLGVEDDAGALRPYAPPELVLPVDAHVGAEWEGVHVLGDSLSERACAVDDSDLCDGGLVSVCESDVEQGGVRMHRMVMRQHFCPDIGWSGYEALLLTPEATMRVWTEDVERDGIPLDAARRRWGRPE